MVINGKDMVKECEKRFQEYLEEIEKKNNVKLDEDQLQAVKDQFAAGFSGCLATILDRK